MTQGPEGVEWFVVEVESVQKKKKELFKDPDKGKFLEGLYERMKGKLKKYPPDEMIFSEPKIDFFLGAKIYWVKSENTQILLRAIYYLASGNCVIDRFHLSSEGDVDLEL